MRRFYETLGFKMHFEQPTAVLLNNGDIDLALMTFLDETCLNFRGADILHIHKQALKAGLVSASAPASYTKEDHDANSEGISWMLTDPDGNNLFFDTNEGEVDEAGAALALQRVLDSTAKQLVNVGATNDCKAAYQSEIVEKFMPVERRAKTEFNLDTSPLTELGQFAGYFTYCLKTIDNAASRSFYQAIGYKLIGNNGKQWVEIGTSDCQLDLMTFLGENWLNFRGGDVFELHERMKAADFELEGEPVRYRSDEMDGSAPGAHWNTKDPDGNVVYFDTSDPELIVQGAPRELKRVFDRTLNQLDEINAEADCIGAFKTMIMDRF
jgi:hypothetical protein